jgi:hypothetical protein
MMEAMAVRGTISAAEFELGARMLAERWAEAALEEKMTGTGLGAGALDATAAAAAAAMAMATAMTPRWLEETRPVQSRTVARGYLSMEGHLAVPPKEDDNAEGEQYDDDNAAADEDEDDELAAPPRRLPPGAHLRTYHGGAVQV